MDMVESSHGLREIREKDSARGSIKSCKNKSIGALFLFLGSCSCHMDMDMNWQGKYGNQEFLTVILYSVSRFQIDLAQKSFLNLVSEMWSSKTITHISLDETNTLGRNIKLCQCCFCWLYFQKVEATASCGPQLSDLGNINKIGKTPT